MKLRRLVVVLASRAVAVKAEPGGACGAQRALIIHRIRHQPTSSSGLCSSLQSWRSSTTESGLSRSSHSSMIR